MTKNYRLFTCSIDKRLFLFLVFLIAFVDVWGQYHYETHTVTTDVIKITSTHYKNRFIRSGWRGIDLYDKGNLVHDVNYYKSEKRLDIKYSYEQNAGIETVRSKQEGEGAKLEEKRYYNDDNQIIKKEIYLSTDSIHPAFIIRNHVYEDNKLISYSRTSADAQTDEPLLDKTLITYYPDSVVIEYITWQDELSKRQVVLLDEKGRGVETIIDWQNRDAVITGGRSENGYSRYVYKFDKRGNWIRRYYVTSRGRRILDYKRKIEYFN